VVVSDLHLGLPHRDTFGPAKARAFTTLLDRVVERRSVLVLNGDFLELLHERYGAIRHAYPEIFSRLARVRRLVYVAGNHDADILRDRIKQTRRAVQRIALRHVYGEVRPGLDGEFWLEPRGGARRIRLARGWIRLLRDAAVRATLMELIRHRQGPGVSERDLGWAGSPQPAGQGTSSRRGAPQSCTTHASISEWRKLTPFTLKSRLAVPVASGGIRSPDSRKTPRRITPLTSRTSTHRPSGSPTCFANWSRATRRCFRQTLRPSSVSPAAGKLNSSCSPVLMAGKPIGAVDPGRW
jgi:hypothetical protein